MGKMEAKHTPGPWKSQPFIWVNNRRDGELVTDMSHFSIVTEDSRHRLAKIEVWHWGKDAAEANARLMAAAPFLLEACQLALAESVGQPSRRISREGLDQIRTAIASATNVPE
jgi:hypothetical protein